MKWWSRLDTLEQRKAKKPPIKTNSILHFSNLIRFQKDPLDCQIWNDNNHPTLAQPKLSLFPAFYHLMLLAYLLIFLHYFRCLVTRNAKTLFFKVIIFLIFLIWAVELSQPNNLSTKTYSGHYFHILASKFLDSKFWVNMHSYTVNLQSCLLSQLRLRGIDMHYNMCIFFWWTNHGILEIHNSDIHIYAS